MPRQLDEVTVTATKIKMYYRGDTLIYNADAFQLPDGSMLEDLIRKLDGVTINEHGRIFCNGRVVESMMLEGRKLFDGNPRILLENLGAYTVKNVKVYDYTDPLAKFVGYSSDPDKPLVMDVVLKRQYAFGKWLDIDAGAGTNNRYLGRAFALGFTKNMALSAFVNANNLSSGDNPSQGMAWSPGKANKDECTYTSGGLSFQYGSASGRQTLNSTISVKADKEVARGRSYKTIYLNAGDNYGRDYDVRHSRNLNVYTNHELYLQMKKVNFMIVPKFSYDRYNGRSSAASVTLDTDPGKITKDEIEGIYSSDTDSLLRHLINRYVSSSKSRRNSYEAGLSATSIVVLSPSEMMRHNINISANGNYMRSLSRDFNRYTINYGEDPVPASDVYAYVNTSPSYTVDVKTSAKYEMNIKETHTASLTYEYQHNRNRDTYDRYLLSDLDRVSYESLRLGQLPADADLDAVMDQANSKHTVTETNAHLLSAQVNMAWGDPEDANGKLTLFAQPSLKFLDRRLAYDGARYDTTVVDNSRLPSINVRAQYDAAHSQKRRYSLGLSWSSDPSMFSMSNLVNVVNDVSPLYVYYGNPNLKNGYSHWATFLFSVTNKKGLRDSHRISLRYNFVVDGVVGGTVYDPTSGVRVSSVYNVNGTRRYGASYDWNGTIHSWKNKFFRRLSGQVNIQADYNKNAGMTGQGAAGGRIEPVRSFVYQTMIRPRAELTLNFGKTEHSIRLKCDGSWGHYSGDAKDYIAFTASNINYEISADFQLPSNIKVSSDLRLQTYHGYNNKSLDADSYVWNVSASWYWKKPHLTFALDGYDLLGQIKRVTVSADAFGRTETWRNNLPRYVMLRVHYHIDLSPGQKR